MVDAGTVYASRLFRSPAGDEPFPVISLQADVHAPVPGRTATLLPIEDRQWLITLSGTRGGRPTGDNESLRALRTGRSAIRWWANSSPRRNR